MIPKFSIHALFLVYLQHLIGLTFYGQTVIPHYLQFHYSRYFDSAYPPRITRATCTYLFFLLILPISYSHQQVSHLAHSISFPFASTTAPTSYPPSRPCPTVSPCPRSQAPSRVDPRKIFPLITEKNPTTRATEKAHNKVMFLMLSSLLSSN